MERKETSAYSIVSASKLQSLRPGKSAGEIRVPQFTGSNGEDKWFLLAC